MAGYLDTIFQGYKAPSMDQIMPPNVSPQAPVAPRQAPVMPQNGPSLPTGLGGSIGGSIMPALSAGALAGNGWGGALAGAGIAALFQYLHNKYGKNNSSGILG